MDLKKFRTEMQQRLSEQQLDDVKVRPFICSGSPLNCKIMMVGYNPAREVNLDVFDADIWNDDMGFDRESFAEHYDIASYNDDLQWNRNHIFQQNLIDEISNHPVIETYLYSVITAKKTLLSPQHKHTHVFDWLYSILKPVLVITQNIDVIKYFEREANKTLVRNTFNAIIYRDLHCVILPISHLSKKWNDTEMYHLKAEIDELFNLIDV
ncbi:hypothetical protein MOXK02_09440 [Moraxella sp. K02]